MITNSSITLYHYDGDIWSRRYFETANVFRRIESERNKGLTEKGSAVIRLPTSGDITVKPGDRVIIGPCEAETPPKGNDTLEVVSVTDNRQGSRNMHHWRLECK